MRISTYGKPIRRKYEKAKTLLEKQAKSAIDLTNPLLNQAELIKKVQEEIDAIKEVEVKIQNDETKKELGQIRVQLKKLEEQLQDKAIKINGITKEMLEETSDVFYSFEDLIEQLLAK